MKKLDKHLLNQVIKVNIASNRTSQYHETAAVKHREKHPITSVIVLPKCIT